MIIRNLNNETMYVFVYENWNSNVISINFKCVMDMVYFLRMY